MGLPCSGDESSFGLFFSHDLISGVIFNHLVAATKPTANKLDTRSSTATSESRFAPRCTISF